MIDPSEVIEAFCEVCTQLWDDHDTYRSLFEEDQRSRELFQSTSPYLFNCINRLMVDNLFLQFCRITDPEGSGSKKNLTTNYIVKCMNWSDEVTDTLEQSNHKLMSFRVKIEKARSKRVAHTDLDAQVLRLPNMGKFDPGEDFAFLSNLQEFVNIAYGELHGGNVRPLRPPRGDAYNLIRALEKATLYDRCYRCSEDNRITDLLDFERR